MDKHYEQLTKLYLRLKGYWVTNLILHSEENGNSKSELDILAIKMPFHSQEYRYVEVQDFLESPKDRIEILIGDVKNYRKLDSVEFNKGLRKDRDSIRQLIDWLGVFNFVTEELISKFEKCLNLHRKPYKNNAFEILDVDSQIGPVRFKFTFFCPSLTIWNGHGFKYVHGEEMLDFVWECLNESRKIRTCSRNYDFEG
ncbi:MAG TPA: hypothetical protein VNS32_21570 [Flavisolibacter sp.]|nr:hypothetical protein [Flavisolibacter sp.]